MALPGNKHNIVLTGFMGTGKSVVARELSRLTGYRLVDMDREIEAAEGRSIDDIFASEGEAAFRELEAREVLRVSAERGQVISTGGGVVLRQDNMDALGADGAVVCLSASAEVIYERTRRSSHRPLLKDKDPVARIKAMVDEREPYYREAGAMVETEGKSPYEIALEVLEAVGWKR